MFKVSKKILLLLGLIITATGICGQETDTAGTVPADTVYADKAPPPLKEYDPYNQEPPEYDQYFDNIEDNDKAQIIIRSVPDSFIRRLQNDQRFAYVKTGLKKYEQELPDASKTQRIKKSSFGWATVITYTAIALFIIILIWYLTNNNFIFFKRKSTSTQTPQYQETHKDIFSIDYAAEIGKAVEQKNYRLAIRLQYLELLKRLSEQNLISFMPDKTNFEYLVQMRGSHFFDDFFAVTRSYEYSWYGLFDITDPLYQKINNTFQHFKQKLK